MSKQTKLFKEMSQEEQIDCLQKSLLQARVDILSLSEAIGQLSREIENFKADIETNDEVLVECMRRIAFDVINAYFRKTQFLIPEDISELEEEDEDDN